MKRRLRLIVIEIALVIGAHELALRLMVDRRAGVMSIALLVLVRLLAVVFLPGIVGAHILALFIERRSK